MCCSFQICILFVMAIFNVRGFTLADLYLKATPDEKTAIKWCQDHDLLWQFPQWQLCGRLIQFKEQVRFSSCFCQISHSLRHQTFFDKSHLKISQILRLIYFWLMDRFQQVDYMREQSSRNIFYQGQSLFPIVGMLIIEFQCLIESFGI